MRAEIAALRKQVQDTMYLAEFASTINMVMSHALAEIMGRHGMSRDEIIEELTQIPRCQVGGNPDPENIAHNTIAALIARIDRRNVAAGGHA